MLRITAWTSFLSSIPVEMFALEDLCNLDVAFVIVDPSLVGATIVACSELFLTLFRYSKRKVVGLSLATLQTPETRDGWNQAWYSVLCDYEYSMFTRAPIAHSKHEFTPRIFMNDGGTECCPIPLTCATLAGGIRCGPLEPAL